MSGKGSRRRPRLVSAETEDTNWRRTFGKHDPEDSLELLPDVEPDPRKVAEREFRLNYMRALHRRAK